MDLPGYPKCPANANTASQGTMLTANIELSIYNALDMRFSVIHQTLPNAFVAALSSVLRRRLWSRGNASSRLSILQLGVTGSK